MTTYTRNPLELWNGGSQESATAISAAIAAGNWQIVTPHFHTTPILLVIDQRETIWSARKGDGLHSFSATENEFSFEVSSFEMFIVPTPSGSGRNDLLDELEKRERIHYEMEREAAADPEGAFGGRGNNMRF